MRQALEQFVRQFPGGRDVHIGGLTAVGAETAEQHGIAILAARGRRRGRFDRRNILFGARLD